MIFTVGLSFAIIATSQEMATIGKAKIEIAASHTTTVKDIRAANSRLGINDKYCKAASMQIAEQMVIIILRDVGFIGSLILYYPAVAVPGLF